MFCMLRIPLGKKHRGRKEDGEASNAIARTDARDSQQTFMDRNYYDLVGVSRWASRREIDAAFRRETEVMHRVRLQEDRLSPEGAARSRATLEQRFREITEAYDVLSDAQKRKQYDDFLLREQPPSPAERRAERSRARRRRYVAWCVVSAIVVVASLYFGPPSNFDRLFYEVFMPACLMILFAKIVGPPYPEVYGWDFWDYLGLLFFVLLVYFVSSIISGSAR